MEKSNCKIKILFLTNIPSPYRVAFFSKLGELVDLTVVYELYTASNRNPDWRADGIQITYKEIFLKSIKLISDGGISLKVLNYLNNDYDFVIVGTHGTPTAKLAMFYMRLKNIPYILNLDGMLSCELDEKNWLNKKLRKILFSGARAYFTSGHDTDEYIKKLGIKGEFYNYHFTSISEKDVIEKLDYSLKYGLKDKFGLKENLLLICVARFVPGKGIDTLLKIFNEMDRSDLGLIIIGGDKAVYNSILKNFKASVLKRIYFPGFMGKETLKEYYRASDIFVLPTHHDAWGLVVNEAMGMGLPVVTTNKCGAGLEIIKDGENGYMVNDTDEKALQNRVEKLLDNKLLRDKMAVQNIKTAKQYTIEKMVKDHIRYFMTLSNRIIEIN